MKLQQMNRQPVTPSQSSGLGSYVAITKETYVLKQKKKQDDRLLKQLTRTERKQQEQLRKMIMSDLSFSSA